MTPREQACEAVRRFGPARVSPATLQLCRDGVLPSPIADAPPNPAPWPMLARAVRWMRKDGDRGVGDTVARLASAGGGDTLAEWYERITGQDCGCADRQAALNERYPYACAGVAVV